MSEKKEDRKLEHQHDFDGIEELDNDLPRWWLGIFWVTSILAIFYVPYYHFMHPEKLPQAALTAELAVRDAKAAVVEAAKPKGEDLESQLLARYQAGAWKEPGGANFQNFCMPCHGPDGGGLIGPNFTDDFYLHGGKLSDMVKVITEGVPEKGMIPWTSQFKPDQIEELACYVRSLRGTTPATPKEPQGTKVDADGNNISE